MGNTDEDFVFLETRSHEVKEKLVNKMQPKQLILQIKPNMRLNHKIRDNQTIISRSFCRKRPYLCELKR